MVQTPETGSVPQVESPACIKQTGAVSAARQWRPVLARVHQARGGSHGRSVQADESGDVLSCVRSPGACSWEPPRRNAKRSASVRRDRGRSRRTLSPA